MPFRKFAETDVATTIASGSVNRYGQLHIITENGMLYQFDTLGNRVKELSIREISGASLLEAWPTLRLLVFSESLQQAYWVDRLLGAPQPITLPEEYYYSCVGVSVSNDFWAYDSQQISLHHLNTIGAVDMQIPLRSTAIGKKSPVCVQIQARHDKVYLAFKGQGIVVCNAYGSVLDWLAVPNLQSMVISEGSLYVFSDHQVQIRYLNQLQEVTKSLALPQGEWMQWAVYASRFFGISTHGVHFFTLLE